MSTDQCIESGTAFRKKHNELVLLRLEHEVKSFEMENRLKEKDSVADLFNQYKQVCNCSIIDDHAKRLFKEAFMRLLPDSESFTHCQNESTKQQHVEPEQMQVEESDTKGSVFNKSESLDDVCEGKLVSSPETNTMKNTQCKVDTEKSLRKTKKRSAFSLKDLLDELHIELDPIIIPIVCRTVCSRFSREYPGSKRFSKHRRTYFYSEDRKHLKEMMKEEYFKYLSQRKARAEKPKQTMEPQK